MSKLLLKVEAIEARVASYSCPLGTTGRVHTLRLRRRFQARSRTQSTVIGGIKEWDRVYDASAGSFPEFSLNNQLQQLLGQTELAENVQIPSARNEALSSPGTIENNSKNAPYAKAQAALPEMHKGLGHIQRSPPHMREAYMGDMGHLPWVRQQFSPEPQNLNGSQLRKVLRSEHPHAILSALIGLIRVGDDGYQGSRVLHTLPPNAFSEVLRMLDPVHFVGRYVDIHSQIGSKNSAYFALRSHRDDGLHKFCVNFIGRIRSIIEARRQGGYALSLSDYKYLLRCARAVGNPRSSHAIWLAMEQDAVSPDTECYNHYLATKVWSDLLHGTQRYDIRVLPKHLELRKAKTPSPEFRGHVVGQGVGIKYQTTLVFDSMIKKGLVGDEETFCLLLVALAREGDIDGVKSILRTLWGVDVDRIMNGEGDPIPPRAFATGSSLRPSGTLLFSIAHAIGINNEIPVALRLVDYVSRAYSIDIPVEVWEELLEWTYVLSTSRTSKGKDEGLSTGQLPPEAVSNLWAALTAEPYNIKPSMAMYDKMIVNLLRRQRFGEAQQRIEEALQLHFDAVQRYGVILALIERHSSLPCRSEKDLGEPLVGESLVQRFLDLKRDETYQHLSVHRSRQYLRRWCRLFLNLGPRSLRRNPVFAAVNIPVFIQKYNTFMPRLMEYPIATGVVRFRTGYEKLNKASIEGYKARRLGIPLAKSTRRSNQMPSSAATVAIADSGNADPLTESEEMFGRS